jgi:hypothetical protein
MLWANQLAKKPVPVEEQHRLYLRPLPQGQSWFRPILVTFLVLIRRWMRVGSLLLMRTFSFYSFTFAAVN